MRYVREQGENKNVFSKRLMSLLMAGSLRLSDNQFHSQIKQIFAV